MNSKKWRGLVLGFFVTFLFINTTANAGVIEDTIGNMSKEELAGTVGEVPPQVQPTLTEAIVREVVSNLLDKEKWNGILGIARKNKISTRQVREINRVRLEKLKEFNPVEIEKHRIIP